MLIDQFFVVNIKGQKEYVSEMLREVAMCIPNLKKAEISYCHAQEIQKIFKNYIKGELCIDHFSVNVFFGNGESIFLSPTPQMAEELCKKNFVSVDSNYKKETYTKYAVYPWRSVENSEMDMVINHIKEEKFGMRNGMMIVRDLGEGRYVMYSFATRKLGKFDGQFYFLYHCKANYIAQMGDFMYNELLPVINGYSQHENIVMPRINDFDPINLEQSFRSDSQKELFYSESRNTSSSLLRSSIEKSRAHLKLINGGKIEY
jgi:hypothetical protein